MTTRLIALALLSIVGFTITGCAGDQTTTTTTTRTDRTKSSMYAR